MILPREAQRNGGEGDLAHCLPTFDTPPVSAPSTTLRAVPLPRFAVEDQEQRP